MTEAAAVLRGWARGPAVVIGHSMGGLHAWCLAAAYPELVRAVVVEDMAPDFQGRTLGAWEPWLKSWPAEFAAADAVDALVGSTGGADAAAAGRLAGRYFRESFDPIRAGGYRLHGHIDRWCAIAALWGERNFWTEWEAVRVPSLLVEAKRGVTPQGQMREMAARNPNARHALLDTSHLAHDEAPEQFERLVSGFVTRVRATV